MAKHKQILAIVVAASQVCIRRLRSTRHELPWINLRQFVPWQSDNLNHGS